MNRYKRGVLCPTTMPEVEAMPVGEKCRTHDSVVKEYAFGAWIVKHIGEPKNKKRGSDRRLKAEVNYSHRMARKCQAWRDK